MNQGWTYTDGIRPQDVGMTVLDFYTTRYRHSSRAQWQQRIENGQVQLNGHIVGVDQSLFVGQRLEYHRPPWKEPDVPLSFDEIFRDDDLLIVNKPTGLPVLPGGNFLHHTLLHQLQRRYPKHPPVPVHRLGRGTSGLMVLARSRQARSVLSRQFRESTAAANDPHCHRRMRKTYLALLGPSTLPDFFAVTTPIGKVPHPVLGYVYGACAQGLPARSEGKVLRRTAQVTLVEVTIHTGRPHQIRIHMAAMGYPLLGDPIYEVGGLPRPPDCNHDGAIPVPGDVGYCLHSGCLTLAHPTTQAEMTWTCEIPASFKAKL
jgi:23S rRNA pseudouridine1911/1915/1917 synthase